jgi:hypothetical protein
MTDRDGQANDVLDRALAALCEAPVPEGPSPQLVASTLEVMQPMTGPPTVRIDEKRRQFMFRILRQGGSAAAAVAIVAVAGWLFLTDRTAVLAFADVVQNLKDAKSMTCVTEMPTIIKGTKRGILLSKLYIQGDVLRNEIPSAQPDAEVAADAPPLLMVVILDAKQKKALMLECVGKTAKVLSGDDKVWAAMATSMIDPMKQLRQLKEQDADRLGDEDLDGVKTQVYRIHRTDIFMGMRIGKDEMAKLWVDPKSGLPVRLVVGDPTDKEKMFFVFKDFHWNVDLDPELFNLNVPKGYTVKDK